MNSARFQKIEMKKANIYMHDRLAGILTEDENGYHFKYLPAYLENSQAEPISLTLPLRNESYRSQVLFPFFDGLLPEGWLLELAIENRQLNPLDRMSLLLETGKDCVGAVSIQAIEEL